MAGKGGVGAMMRLKPAWELRRENWFRPRVCCFKMVMWGVFSSRDGDFFLPFWRCFNGGFFFTPNWGFFHPKRGVGGRFLLRVYYKTLLFCTSVP